MTKTGTKAHSLAAALALARDYWDSKGPSCRMMGIRAERCVAVLGSGRGVVSLTSQDGTKLLTALQDSLSPSSVKAYYAAFRRMLTLSGYPTPAWPSAGTVPRRLRRPMGEEALTRLMRRLREDGRPETADLCSLLRETGMRVEVEALRREAFTVSICGEWLHITGKGGHERAVPLSPEAKAIISDPHRRAGMLRVSYETHRARLQSYGEGCFHSIRHLYATKAYAQSGKDLTVVRDLLGHSDINTTAGYIGVDREALCNAVL